MEKFILTPGYGTSYTVSGKTADSGVLFGGNSYDVGVFNNFSIVTRYDSSGNFLWSSRLPQPYSRLMLSVKESPWGDIYSAGYTPETPVAFEDGFVNRLDANGNYLSRTLIGSLLERCDDIEFTSDYSVYACGYGLKNYNGNYYPDLAYLIKCDSAMNVKWKINYDNIYSNQTYFHRIHLLQDGNIMLGGWVIKSSGKEILLVKTDTSGTILWSKSYNRLQNNQESFIDFRELSSGEILVFGDAYDYFFGLKVSATGDPVWMKNWKSEIRITNDYLRSAALPGGNFLLCASGYDTLTTNKGTVLLEIDTTGNSVKSFLLGPPSVIHRYAVAEAIGTNNILLRELVYMPPPSAKYFSSLITYPPDPAVSCNVLAYNFTTSSDSFSYDTSLIDTVFFPLLVWKQPVTGVFVTQSDSVYCISTGIGDPPLISEITLFPNPASETIRFNFSFENRAIKIELSDIQGKIFPAEIKSGNNFATELDIRHLYPGNYLLRIILDSTTHHLKFVKI